MLESLTVSTTTYDGEAWDAFGGAPDPFVEIRVGSETATPIRTGAGSDTFAVTFNGSPSVTNVRADAIRTYLRFDAWDADATTHDHIGACAYRGLGEGPFGGSSQTTTCARNPATRNSGFTLRWHLDRF